MSGLGAHAGDVAGASGVVEVVGVVGPLLLLVVAGVAYGVGVRLVHRRIPGRRWSQWRSASWGAGLAVLAVGASPLVERYAPGELTSHTAQHLLLGMLGPLLLVLAAPVTLLLGASSTRGRGRVAAVLRSGPVRVLSEPVVAAASSVGGMLVLYLTPLYAASQADPRLHALVHLHLVASGALFAYAIAGPDPAPHRPSVTHRAVVLVAAAAVHAVLAKALYAAAPALPPGSGADVADVQRAAQLMWYGGDAVELLLAGALFAGWYRLRRRTHRPRPAAVTRPAPDPIPEPTPG